MIKVLVTDDEKAFLQLIHLAVHQNGLEIHKAANGLQALERARSVSPDVVITRMNPKQIEALLQDCPAIRYVLPKPCSLEALRAAFKAALGSRPSGPA